MKRRSKLLNYWLFACGQGSGTAAAPSVTNNRITPELNDRITPELGVRVAP